jgi:GT2 family glycosyltransferase
MKKLSFILPVRIDGDDRMRNLLLCIEFLNLHFKFSEIIIVENDSKAKLKNLSKKYNIEYLFIENESRFSKSQTSNLGVLHSSRKFIALYDADVIIDPEAIYRSVAILDKNQKKVIIPHNSVFVNVKGKKKEEILNKLDYVSIPYYKSPKRKNTDPDIELYTHLSGIVLFNREMLIMEGGFNKKMISYGWEDNEVLKRLQKIGYYYYCLKEFNLIHLDHNRGEDSKQNEYYMKNKEEYERIIHKSRKELVNYIDDELVIDSRLTKKQKQTFRHKQQIMNLLTFQFFQFWFMKIYIHVTVNKGLF